MKEVTYTTRRRDVVRLHFYHYTHHRWFRLFLAAMLLVVAWAIARPFSSCAFAFVFVAALVFSTVLFLLIIAGTALLTTSRSDLGVVGEHRIELQDDGLTEETRVNRSKNTWEGIRAVKSTGRYIMIYTTQSAAHPIPKRAFPSPAEADAFFRFAEERWRSARGSTRQQ